MDATLYHDHKQIQCVRRYLTNDQHALQARAPMVATCHCSRTRPKKKQWPLEQYSPIEGFLKKTIFRHYAPSPQIRRVYYGAKLRVLWREMLNVRILYEKHILAVCV